jgi:hypothetical protein
VKRGELLTPAFGGVFGTTHNRIIILTETSVQRYRDDPDRRGSAPRFVLPLRNARCTRDNTRHGHALTIHSDTQQLVLLGSMEALNDWESAIWAQIEKLRLSADDAQVRWRPSRPAHRPRGP